MSASIGIIGNGFDLAHGLPTRYSDFLEILKDPKLFRIALESSFAGREFDTEKYGRYFSHLSKLEMNQVNEMLDLLESNVWAYYYGHCEAEMEGWIDFESEIVPALKFFDLLFGTEIKVEDNNQFGTIVDFGSMPQSFQRTSLLFRKFLGRKGIIKRDYVTNGHGLLKAKIMDELQQDFDALLEAMKIYFYVFVDRLEIENLDNPFFHRHYDKLISFNYTVTEKKYKGLCDKDPIHIHGSIMEDPCNLVLGTEELEWDKDNKYYYFTKSSQMIRHNLLSAFNINEIEPNSFIYIYGHSFGRHDHEFFSRYYFKGQIGHYI